MFEMDFEDQIWWNVEEFWIFAISLNHEGQNVKTTSLTTPTHGHTDLQWDKIKDKDNDKDIY